MKAWSASLMFAVLLVAGCSGPSDAGQPGHVEAPPADPGVLGGQVLDDEQRPVAAATVDLVSTNASSTTDTSGRFQFVEVSPGLHTLRVSHPLFETKEVTVEVVAGKATDATITLIALPTEAAYSELFPFSGMQQCMFSSPSFKSGCGYPYTAAYWTLHGHGVNLTQYGLPSDVFDNNYRYNFTVGANHTGIVSELAWTASTDAAKFYSLELSCAWYDPVVDDCVAPGQTTWEAGNLYVRARGVSPLRVEWTHDKPEWLPWVMSRAYLWSDVSMPVGAAFEQRVDMYNTVFYGAAPPVGYAVAAAQA